MPASGQPKNGGSFGEYPSLCFTYQSRLAQIARGIGTGRSGDISRLKEITAKLASNNGRPLSLVSDAKSDRGFNNDATGRMLISIRDLKAYNEDPVG